MYKQAIVVFALLVSFSSVAQAGLVGTGLFLYDIDPVNGVATNPRETDEFLAAVTFGNGTLYGLGAERFFTVDVSTGELHLLGVVEGFASHESTRELAWDSKTDTFFAITQIGGTAGSQLVSFDLDTLALTTIGSAHGATALAFDDTGTLFALGLGQERFFTLDKTDAQILSSIGVSRSLGNVNGMSFAPDGTLFVASNIDRSNMTTLDPTTGVLEVLGPTNAAGGILSLAYVPEPGTLLLLGASALLTLRCRHLGCVPDAPSLPFDRER